MIRNQTKIIVAILGAIAMGCGAPKMITTNPENVTEAPKTTTNTTPSPTTSPTSTKQVLSFSDAGKTGEIITFLASDDLKGREAGSEGIATAATYIEDIFKANGIKPYFASYRDTLNNFTGNAFNVVGVLPGNDPELKGEYVILGAHYDHIGEIAPGAIDAIANGANDNASGTTTVLELARYFATNKNNKRSIIFALFTAEEKGLLGSKHLSEKLKAENLNLYTMLNFEMVGVALQNKDYFLYLTGYQNTNMAQIGNAYAGENLIGFLPSAAKMNLFKRSDNYPFHEQFNVPSQTFCTFDFTNFDHYHKVGDEADIMDFEHMAAVVNRLIPAVQGIIDGPKNEVKFN